MDIKNARNDFIIALWLAFVIYIAGMTYLMVDIQMRLGDIEHQLVHLRWGAADNPYCSHTGK